MDKNKMNFNEFMKMNPFGKGSALMNMGAVYSNLDDRYKLMMKRRDITYTVYYGEGSYYIHFIVPSESEKDQMDKMTYDVVIMFDDEDGSHRYDNFLYKVPIRVFCNAPSHVFTYAYVYRQNDMSIPFLDQKYTHKPIKDKPKVRNPQELMMHEKHIYFACKFIEEHQALMAKSFLNPIAMKMNKREFYNGIRSITQILDQIKGFTSVNMVSQEPKTRKQVEKKRDAEATKIQPTRGANRISGKKTTVSDSVYKNRVNSTTNIIKPKRSIGGK